MPGIRFVVPHFVFAILGRIFLGLRRCVGEKHVGTLNKLHALVSLEIALLELSIRTIGGL